VLAVDFLGVIGLALGGIHMPVIIAVLKELKVAVGKFDNNGVTRIKNTDIK
jgi:hypothetical protein